MFTSIQSPAFSREGLDRTFSYCVTRFRNGLCLALSRLGDNCATNACKSTIAEPHTCSTQSMRLEKGSLPELLLSKVGCVPMIHIKPLILASNTACHDPLGLHFIWKFYQSYRLSKSYTLSITILNKGHMKYVNTLYKRVL